MFDLEMFCDAFRSAIECRGRAVIQIKELPAGRDRYILTLVRTGLNRDVAYTLADDVSAMSQDSLVDKIDAQTEAITAHTVRIDAQSVKIDAQTEAIKAQSVKIDAQTEAIKAQSVKIDAQTEAIKAQSVKIDAFQDTLRAFGRSLDLITSTLIEHGKTIRSMETRHAEALKALEARFSRQVEPQIRLLWIVVGAGVLGMLAAIANWASKALGI